MQEKHINNFVLVFRSSIDGPLEFRQYFENIKSYGNIVNLSRATVPFVVSFSLFLNGVHVQGTV